MIKKAILLLTLCLTMAATSQLAAERIGDADSTEILSPEDTTSSAEAEAQRDRIIEKAMLYLGRPYVHGTAGPRSFDCSGFTSYVYSKENISLSRSSRTQYTQGTAVRGGISSLRRGDLVFFGGSRSTRSVGHVGIVVDVSEDGKSFDFVHAARGGVKVSNSNSAYYSRRYLGARRVING